MNLLTEKLITPLVLDQVDEEPITLPALMALLHDETKEVIGFRHLQTYQTHAWYAFLTQLCAIAHQSHQENSAIDFTSPQSWLNLLRSLTSTFIGDEPWLLLNPDLKSPAFMQPAIPENSLNNFRLENTPDSIDLLVLSKNHDLKQEKIHSPHPSHWIYALVSLQTMQGFSGRDNYGISRMNGGFGNRSCVTFVNNPFSWGQRLRDDIQALLKWREMLCNDFRYKEEGGIALVWLEPWDGTNSLHFQDLDPFYIEICRRIRLQNNETGIICWRKPTTVSRIDAKSRLGYVGDPWLITVAQETKDQPKSLTVAETGFTYSVVQELLFNAKTHRLTPVQMAATERQQGWCLMHTLVRGQGETKGYHERTIPIPPKNYDISDSSNRENIAATGKIMVDYASQYRKVLRDSLFAFFQGRTNLNGKQTDFNFKDVRPTPWLKRFDQKVDPIYFSELWRVVDSGEVKSWLEKLEKFVNELFFDAANSYTTESSNYIKRKAEASRWLAIMLSKKTNNQ